MVSPRQCSLCEGKKEREVPCICTFTPIHLGVKENPRDCDICHNSRKVMARCANCGGSGIIDKLP